MIKNQIVKIINYISKKKIMNILLNLIDLNLVFLNYHRVLKDSEFNNIIRPDNDLVVSKSIFESQIKFLKENFNVISINEIGEKIKNKSVVITFDDGYYDNIENALPILEKYKCSATIYVATSFLDDNATPWWFELWDIINFNKEIFYDGNYHDVDDYIDKKKNYKILSNKLMFLDQKHQKNILNSLIPKNFRKNKENNKIFLSTQDLTKLKDNDLIEIGCHTHTHPNLKILKKSEIYDEICISNKILENIIQRKINHFSIPYGTSKCFDNEILKQISNFGFKTVVTTEHGIFKKKKCNQIPRIGIGNDDLDERLYTKSIGLNSLINKVLLR